MCFALIPRGAAVVVLRGVRARSARRPRCYIWVYVVLILVSLVSYNAGVNTLHNAVCGFKDEPLSLGVAVDFVQLSLAADGVNEEDDEHDEQADGEYWKEITPKTAVEQGCARGVSRGRNNLIAVYPAV